jgi:hypothetical protein
LFVEFAESLAISVFEIFTSCEWNQPGILEFVVA